MRAQLRRLAEAAELPHVTLQAVPFTRGGHAGASGAFSILRFQERDLPDVVYIEQLTSALYLDQRPDVEHYLEVVDQLSGEALTPAETTRLHRAGRPGDMTGTGRAEMTSDEPAAPGGGTAGKAKPPTFDTSVANQARIYDYLLGGKDNYAADREAVDAVLKIAPEMGFTARANRAFLGRAVRYLAAEAGIRQFLDIGTGIPTAGNTHHVAQAAAPESRVVYVDYDPIVLAHARALLTSSEAAPRNTSTPTCAIPTRSSRGPPAARLHPAGGRHDALHPARDTGRG